jgi:hypothetical protein
MVTTERTWKPQINRTAPHEGALSQHPAVKGTLRALNLVGGTIAAFLAFVIVGLYGALQYCEGDEVEGLCAGHAGLVPVLEWPIFVIAVVAPFAGGIAAFVTRRPRWLAVGVALAVVMFALMSIVSTGQTSYDWN